MMDRILALEAAVEIVDKARVKVVNNNPGAYAFLLRVSRHLSKESKAAFAAEFREVA